MRRVIAVITSFMMFFLLLVPNETGALASDLKSEFTVLKNTEKHKVFKLKDGETLEQFNEGEESYFIANTEEDSFKIVEENDVVSVINTRNNQVVETYVVEEISEEINIIESDTSKGLQVLEKDSEMGTYQVTNPGNSSKYRYVRTRNMSVEIIATSVSVVAGLIATFIGTKVTGALVTVATGYVGSKLKKLYWKEVLSEYRENIYKYSRWANIFYKYHDYTGHLGSQSKYLKTRMM